MADLSTYINIGANNANFVGEVTTTSTVSTTGNVKGGNLVGGGLYTTDVSAQAIVYVNSDGRLDGDTPSLSTDGNGNVSAYGTITAGALVGNSISTTGNVTANSFLSNGNLYIGPLGFSNGVGIVQADSALVVYGQGANTVASMGWAENIVSSGNIAIIDFNVEGNSSGNITIKTGFGGNPSTWNFDTAGNLTLPRGGVVYETNIPGNAFTGNTIALAPSGGTNADQQLLVYPTVGTDNNHLHLTTGNLYNTELFLGNDELYVKLANSGDIFINTNDNDGNTAQWLFDTRGALTLPTGSASYIQSADNKEQIYFDQSANSFNIITNATYQFVFNGDGTVAFGGGYIFPNTQGTQGQVLVYNPSGSGEHDLEWQDQSVSSLNNTANSVVTLDAYADLTFYYANAEVGSIGWDGGNDLYIASSGGNIEIDVNGGSGTKSWKFDNTGELTTPQGGRLGAAGKGWTGLDGGNGNPLSLTSYYSDGMYSSCINLNPDGSLYIATYGDGTGQQSNWNFSTANLVSIGNSTISIANATSGLGGNNLTIQAGASDTVTFNGNPGGNLNLVGGYGSFGDGGGGPGGAVNISGGGSSDSTPGNVNINSGSNVNINTYMGGGLAGIWTFDNTGVLTIAGNINGDGASPAPSLNGFDSVNALTFSATGNILSGNLTTTGSANIANISIGSYASVPQTWFKGMLSASQNLTANVDSILLYNNNTDPLGWGTTTSTNGHIVPNKPGWYEIISRVEFGPSAGNVQAQVNHQILVNGSQVAISQTPNNSQPGSGVNLVATAFVELNGNTDYIYTQCYTTIVGQQCSGLNSTTLIIKWISS